MLKSLESRSRHKLTILCYHRILPVGRKAAYFAPDLVVTPDAFRRHCETLGRYFEVQPLRRAVGLWRERLEQDRPLAAITFDDGYRDNYVYAAPILREFRFGATFFVIVGLVDSGQTPWFDRLARAIQQLQREKRLRDALGELAARGIQGLVDPTVSAKQIVARVKSLPPPHRRQVIEHLVAMIGSGESPTPDDRIMSWRQLAELADDGHEIGSHSASHELLTMLDDAKLKAEVADSRRMLKKYLGRSVPSFCYPNGDVDDRVVRVVRSAGYECAVTVQSGSNELGRDLHRLRRRFIHEDRLRGLRQGASSLLLRTELCGLADCLFGRSRKSGREGTS